ncbi:Ocs element-binding factor 1 [Apostasia shenzhenica]|uniref:Ocs element-binding factor 1 n=1 Tax=Apostasia shenzhenica TaxID=1088818 RepID=A0A2I0AGH8_9ASPA|nr:Ocs element-binding factor 1 [Apostasia shenzhenica]
MSARPSRQSSSSDDSGPVIDERKRKRMESNRESARRSRMRKQQHLEELVNQIAQLKIENESSEARINMQMQQYGKVESENTILRTQIMELTDRLQSMNSVLRFVAEFSGMAMDIPEIPDPVLKPWQFPSPAQPIIASANMLQ